MYPWLSNTYSSLAQRIATRSLHHGVLFMGTANIGKRALADTLAKKLLCEDISNLEPCGQCKSCSLVQATSHPDLHYVLREKTQIGIDLIRQAISELTNTAQLSGNKVLVIPDAHLMSESASNSLLKTLEEPTDNTFILLTTSQPQRLLATILSRCEKQLVQTPTYKESTQWLLSQNISEPTELALKAFNGSAIAYLNSLSDADAVSYEKFQDLIKDIKGDHISIHKASADWQQNAEQTVNWLGLYFYEQYSASQDAGALKAYELCLVAKQRLRHVGLNKTLLLAVLFENIK